ncbi:MAG: hypothetical protein P1V20_28205 [Verrucomicrobiales bacterium]|nr:hypothetical protein [Verrucomicrobiales bacterium]
MIQNLKILTVLAIAGMALSANGQQQVMVKPGGVKIKGVEKQAQKTPNFQAGDVSTKKVPNPREWLEIEVEFEVDGASPRDGVLSELLFRYYVGMKDERGNPVALTGDANYVNVIAGEEYYSAMYVPPSTLGKITGEFRRFNANSVAAVGVEIFYNGVLVGKESNAGDFWTKMPTQAGVLSREKTPFALLWIDRYPEVKAN